MYAVIEFTNYRKKQDIIIHGYSDNIENANNFAKTKCLKQIYSSDNTKIYKIDELNINNTTINLIDGQNSTVLNKYCLIEIERTPEEECNKICKRIKENNKNIDDNNITICDFINYFNVTKTVFEIINKDFNLDEKLGHDIDVQKYIVDYLKLKDYGYFNKENYVYYSQVFGVVKINPLLL